LQLPSAGVLPDDGESDTDESADDESEDVEPDNNDVIVVEKAATDNVASTSKPIEQPQPGTSGLPDLEPVRSNVLSKGKGVGKSSAVKEKPRKSTKTKSPCTDTEILKEIARNMHVMNERRAIPPLESKTPTPDEMQIKSFCDLIGSTMLRIPRHLWSNAIMDCLYTLSRYENMESGQSMTVPKSLSVHHHLDFRVLLRH
jgi:hypothetical protein